jgi:hypothetical protein
MAFYPGTKPFKHGLNGYDVHHCHCSVCSAAKAKKGNEYLAMRRGKEPPKHGTSTAYCIYGCRCAICVNGNKERKAVYRKQHNGKEPPKHGMTGYDSYGCRCDVCVSARRESDLRLKSNPKFAAQEKERCWIRQGIKGFTYEDFCKRFDEQNGKCFICGKEIKKTSNKKSEIVNVDHDHATGKVRALLCNPCNKMLGHGVTPQILRKGADYLELHVIGDGK